MKPYITIITSTYNASKTLKRCLDSVESQLYPNIEHIIIDGNSSDGTQEIIAQHASKDDSRISYWISEQDSGIYDAWNKAIPHINGEWVLFLGADDYYLEDIFSKVVPVLEKQDDKVTIAYGKVFVFNGEDGQIKQTSGKAWVDYKKKGFFRGVGMLPHQAVFHRSSLFKTNKFDINYKIGADYNFLYPVLLERSPIFIDMPIAMYSDGGVSSNINNLLECLRECKQTVLKYNQKPSIILKFGVIKIRLLLFLKTHNLKILFNIISKISV